MTITKNDSHSQFIIFLFCMSVFCTAAVFGWIKLQYGFNFIDEGYHMTESWRLSAGDDFLQDKLTGALIHYTLINSLIFKSCPDITLLDFRKLQYIFTILSLLIFSYSLFKVSRQYCWLPFIFSIYAFTGLDPTGMISNLDYHAYPHLFLTLHVSFFLLGLYLENPIKKKTCYLLSGVLLWGISISCLYLSVIILSPILIFFLSQKLNIKLYSFTFKDLLYVLSSYIFCWLIFLIIFNKPYINNIIESLNLALSMSQFSVSSSTGLFAVNWEAIKHVSISLIFLSIYFFFTKKKSLLLLITGCAILSIVIFIIINTSFFGLLTAYYSGRFGPPTWFSSMLIAFFILFWIHVIIKYFLKKKFSREESLSVSLMIPFSICAITKSTFSDFGIMSVSQASIPAVAAMSFIVAYNNKKQIYEHSKIIVILIFLFAPFYFTTAKFDWNFTYYDVPPKLTNARIDKGFGKGIYTNRIYFKLYEWIEVSAEKYTSKNDFIISYVISPMVHMITKRRPALDDTFNTFSMPLKYYEKSIAFMRQRNRLPKMAFVFESMPRLAQKNGKYFWLSKQFIFDRYSPDPISKYINKNMVLVDEFRLSDNNKIRCFVDKNHLNEIQTPVN